MFGHLNGDDFDTYSLLPMKRSALAASRCYSISQMTISDNSEYKNTTINETDNVSTMENKSQMWTIKVPDRIIKKTKTLDQLMYLEKQFALDPEWSKKTISQCAKVLTLKRKQIYKWGYNKKKAVAASEQGTSKNSSLFAEFPCLLKLRDIKDMNKMVDEIDASVREPVTDKDEWLESLWKITANNSELNDGTESISSYCPSTKFKAFSAIAQERRWEESIFDTYTENNDLFSISHDFNPAGTIWDEFKSERIEGHSLISSHFNYTLEGDHDPMFTDLNSVQRFDAILEDWPRSRKQVTNKNQLDLQSVSEFSNYLGSDRMFKEGKL